MTTRSHPTAPPRVFLLTLPLPPRELAANYVPATVRKRIYRDRAKRAYRLQCRAEANAGSRERPTAARVTLRITYVICRPTATAWGCYRPDDPSNAIVALKPAIDSLVDAGYLPDDSDRYVADVSCRIERHQRHRKGEWCSGSRVEVTITESAP